MFKVYIAGPYTNGDNFENVRNAVDMAEYVFINAPYAVVPIVPHLQAFWNLLYPHGWETWMTFDLAMLETCDALIRLPGQSEGASKEEDRARAMKIPVFHDPADLFVWMEEQ